LKLRCSSVIESPPKGNLILPGITYDVVLEILRAAGEEMGGLLTKAGGQSGLGVAGDERIAFQRRVEEKYRAQVVQLLTPLVGAGTFSTEIQADVDLDEAGHVALARVDERFVPTKGSRLTCASNVHSARRNFAKQTQSCTF